MVLPWRVSTRVIFGWDAGVALYIALIFLVMAQGSIAKIRRRAAINDEGAIALLVLTAAASLASLASVLAELGHSPSPYQILLGIATILLSWTFMHTVFALHYAHEFYGEGADDRMGGLAATCTPTCGLGSSQFCAAVFPRPSPFGALLGTPQFTWGRECREDLEKPC